MWSKAAVCLVACMLVWIPSAEATALTLEQQDAKDRGTQLFNQRKPSKPELRIAAVKTSEN